jgi:carboxy-cis,cis-muconate cyclase
MAFLMHTNRMILHSVISLVLLTSVVVSKQYRLAIGTFGKNYYTATFDSETKTITHSNTYTASGNVGKWLEPNAAKTLLYGCHGIWSINGTRLEPLSNTQRSNGDFFLDLTSKAFYTIGEKHLEAWSLNSAGGLATRLNNISFGDPSFSHGITVSPEEDVLYVPDIRKNAIRTFSIGPTGALTSTGIVQASSSGAGPRHAAVHPNGKYVYVINESVNTIDVFTTGSGTRSLTYSRQTLNLLPSGRSNSNYYSCEISISPDRSTLFASVRGRNANNIGYLWGFSLNVDGVPAASPLFRIDTPTSGGEVNTFTLREEAPGVTWLAMGDKDSSVRGFHMYRFDGKNVTLVARSRKYDADCCTHVAWLD